jgi:hypothetical protein
LGGGKSAIADMEGGTGNAGMGGGAGKAMLGTRLDSLDFGRFGSIVFLLAIRMFAGKEETGRDAFCAPGPDVCGRFASIDTFGRGPNFTFGLLYCAYISAYRSDMAGRAVWEDKRGSGPFSKRPSYAFRLFRISDALGSVGCSCIAFAMS